MSVEMVEERKVWRSCLGHAKMGADPRIWFQSQMEDYFTERGTAPKWSWVRFLFSDPRVVQVLGSIVLITSRASGRRISGTQHENPECVMLAVTVLRAQNLRSCPAVGNQMLSKRAYYAGSELLTLCRSQASSFHQRGRVFLSEFFCAAYRERTGPEAAETPLVQAPVFKQSMRWCLVW